MKNNLFIWQFIGVTFTAVLGTFLHFSYGLTNSSFVALFSAVNESTFEHMKLVFMPSLLFAVIQYFFAKNDYNCFWLIKLIGIVVGTLLIPVLFYTLTGSFSKLSGVTNIIIFFVSVFVEYLIEYLLFKKLNCNKKLNFISFIALIIILLLFFIFTFYPPKIPLFLDPVTNGYGIVK